MCELPTVDKGSKVSEEKFLTIKPSSQACPAFAIRIMTEDDLRATAQWATKEGWNPGYADGGAFQQADHEGFFMGHLDGQRAVTISSVRYGDGFGFIGLCICAPKYRGKGFSLVMFKRAMEHLDGRVIGLDAVGAQEARYAAQGFATAHDVIRFKGRVVWDEVSDGDIQRDGSLVVERPGEDSMQSLLEFDRQHFPAARERFVRAWVHNPGHVARVALRNGRVVGYGVCRPSENGARVGPLFATSSSVASALLKAITGDDQEVEVCVDVPGPNLRGVELAENVGLKRLCSFKRMYRGAPPYLPMQSIFAVTTALELG